MTQFVYPASSGTGGTGGQSGFPTITVGNPSARTYSATSVDEGVILPVFSVSGTGSGLVEFFTTSGDGTFDFGIPPDSITVDGDSIEGDFSDLNTVLQSVVFYPADGSAGTITYNVSITDDTDNVTQLPNDCSVLDSNVNTTATGAETTVSITGTNGTIQLLVNGTAISGVVAMIGDLDGVAQDMVQSINTHPTTPKCTAQDLIGGSLNVSVSKDAGAQANGWKVTANVTGDMQINNAVMKGGATGAAVATTWLDKIVNAAEGVLPYVGAGVLLNLLYQNLGQAQVTVPVSSANVVPDVAVVYEGRIINVPNNYDAVNRVYNGAWDGVTFVQAYTKNPAWCALDYLSNKRFGCGNNFRLNQTQWQQVYAEHYAAAQYCDQLVSNGANGTEPRFSLNVAIAGMSKIDALQAIAGNMFAQYVFPDNVPRLVQDRPSVPKAIVSNANATSDGFSFSGTNMANSYNYVEVNFNNAANLFESEATFVLDGANILSSYERPYQITAFGVTSVSQAKRYGNWVISNEKQDPLMVTYTAGLDHANLIPGDVVLLLDNKSVLPTTPYRQAGRILQVNSQFSLQIDRQFSPASGANYVTCVMPDGSLFTNQVTGFDVAAQSTLTFSAPFPSVPLQYSMWLHLDLSEWNMFSYKIMTHTELTPGTYQITAVRYNTDKYSLIDNI